MAGIKQITDGAETYGADLDKGCIPMTMESQNPNLFLREDTNGDTYVGDTFSPPQGFLNRPQGWER